MDVWINGEHTQLGRRAVVADALATMHLPRRGVAVSVDGHLVRRAEWSRTPLRTAARVEVLTVAPAPSESAA